MGGFDFAQPVGYQLQSLFPASFAEAVALTDERHLQTFRTVDVIPAELTFHASGDIICRALRRLDFENVTILGPDIEAAAHAAISADRLGPLHPHLTHRRLGHGNAHDRADTQSPVRSPSPNRSSCSVRLRQAGEVARVPEHGFFHQRIARADADAMATGDTTGAGDLLAAIPQHAGMSDSQLMERVSLTCTFWQASTQRPHKMHWSGS